MTREEFLQKLGAELRLNVSERVIAEQLSFYDAYIAEEVQKGRTEAEVIGELEDPRLLARTISEAAEAGGDRVALSSPFRDESVQEPGMPHGFEWFSAFSPSEAEEEAGETGGFGAGTDEEAGAFPRSGMEAGRNAADAREGDAPQGFSGGYPFGRVYRFGSGGCLIAAILCIAVLTLLFIVADYLLIYFAPFLAVLALLWLIKKIMDRD